MCLWLLTACLGLLPSSPVIVVPGVPTPIIQPTTAPTTAVTNATTTTARPTMAPTAAPTPAPTTAPTPAPTTAPTPAPTTAPTPAPTTAPTPAPTTAPTPAPTTAPTPAPTTATTAAPTPPPTMPPTAMTTRNGSFPIDPRLGTTPSAALQSAQPIMGYSGQISSLDSAVRFPRERRSVNRKIMTVKESFKKLNYIDPPKHQIRKRQSCRCVPAGTCASGGAGMIDFRIVTPVNACPAGQVYCCGDTTAVTVRCGVVQAAPSTGVTPAAGEANFGEYPWQALVLTKQNDYIAGGVLIDQLNVLTVTHRMMPYVVSGTAPNVKVRLGEWDAAGTNEPVPFQEYNVAKVFSHPSYNANTLQYDIMVIRLSSSVPLTPMTGSTTTINRACLPPSSTATYTGLTCWVSGWGKNMFGLQGQYQNILKKVDVPIVAPATCQSQLQAARLGPTYVLDTTSFICAGGESSKDSCTGDGGSGLVCSINGQWIVVGLVAWGLGCASANVPAAYVNVAALLPWIQQQVATA
ncbi:serine proteinase stubble-like [Danaus plexippus]|uniref:serine proteinase stubble-like n=1 Tax=Danaus plexippus TaxID=13037 RepID=UPI002AB11BEA|nr:serine proteinase stubble-like [Danaus plexippus]